MLHMDNDSEVWFHHLSTLFLVSVYLPTVQWNYIKIIIWHVFYRLLSLNQEKALSR